MGRSSSLYAILWKYLFSSPTSYFCQEIPTIVGFAISQKLISTSEFFLQGVGLSSSYYLYTYKIQLVSTSVTWANRMACPSSSWSCSNSENVLRSDSSIIYNFFTYGYNTYMYMITFSVSSGNVLGSRYKSNSVWASIKGTILYGNYVMATAQWGKYYFFIFDTNSNLILTKYFTIKIETNLKRG